MSELSFTLDDLANYTFDASFRDSNVFRILLRNSGFVNNPDSLAIVSCGGTISSAFSPAKETIRPTTRSPVADTLEALNTSFGIAHKNVSTISLLDKDSRDITPDDMKFILDFLNSIQNKRIALTCGTYGLPLFTQIIDKHAIGSDKIIGITGSMLISSMREHDVDFNAGAVVSAINISYRSAEARDTPLVFAAFHGEVYNADQCKELNLHLESHKDVEFYRGQPLI